MSSKLEIVVQDFVGFIAEYAANISPGGMFLATGSPRPPDTPLDVDIRLKDGFTLIRGRGVVAWVRETAEGPERPAGMGVRFTDLDDESRELVDRIVNNHVAEGGTPFELEQVAPPVEPEPEPGPPVSPPAAAPHRPPAPPQQPPAPPVASERGGERTGEPTGVSEALEAEGPALAPGMDPSQGLEGQEERIKAPLPLGVEATLDVEEKVGSATGGQQAIQAGLVEDEPKGGSQTGGQQAIRAGLRENEPPADVAEDATAAPAPELGLDPESRGAGGDPLGQPPPGVPQPVTDSVSGPVPGAIPEPPSMPSPSPPTSAPVEPPRGAAATTGASSPPLPPVTPPSPAELSLGSGPETPASAGSGFDPFDEPSLDLDLPDGLELSDRLAESAPDLETTAEVSPVPHGDSDLAGGLPAPAAPEREAPLAAATEPAAVSTPPVTPGPPGEPLDSPVPEDESDFADWEPEDESDFGTGATWESAADPTPATDPLTPASLAAPGESRQVGYGEELTGERVIDEAVGGGGEATIGPAPVPSPNRRQPAAAAQPFRPSPRRRAAGGGFKAVLRWLALLLVLGAVGGGAYVLRERGIDLLVGVAGEATIESRVLPESQELAELKPPTLFELRQQERPPFEIVEAEDAPRGHPLTLLENVTWAERQGTTVIDLWANGDFTLTGTTYARLDEESTRIAIQVRGLDEAYWGKLLPVKSRAVSGVRFGFNAGQPFNEVVLVIDLARRSPRLRQVELDGSHLRLSIR